MWLNKWVHKLFLQCRSRSFFNLKPMSVIVYQFQTVKFIQMMSLTFGLFTQVSGSGPLGPLVSLTSSLRSQLVKCFTTLKPNTLIFFVGKMREAFALQKLLTFF